jgi:putative transposase
MVAFVRSSGLLLAETEAVTALGWLRLLRRSVAKCLLGCQLKTLQLKLRPGSEEWLNAAAIEVNQCWNYFNEVSAKAAMPYFGKPKFLGGFDLVNLASGAYEFFGFIKSATINQIAKEYAARRRQFKKRRLAWRVSHGRRRSLGWVPFRDEQVRFKAGAIVFAGRRFRVYDSYGLGKYELRAGNFSQNALGEWFVNVAVKSAETKQELPAKAVGIDLGLRTIATTSDGQTLPAGRWTQEMAARLANAQRRGHKKQAKRLHRKAANCRKDALHKFSRKLVNECGAIYIGDVSSGKLAKTRMAKSVLDSGWGMLRTMLQYKGHQAGRIVEAVNESFTTRACSNCGQLAGPKGLKQLGVTGWTCGGCGASHSRDVNAAKNILARGLSGPSAGTNGGESSNRAVIAPARKRKWKPSSQLAFSQQPNERTPE